jgi:hypothetical protein
MNDEDYFLKNLDFDVDNVDSIVEWSRRERLRSRSYDEEPQPKPQPKQQTRLTDAEATAFMNTLDQRIEEALDIVAEEAGRTERRLRDEMQ